MAIVADVAPVSFDNLAMVGNDIRAIFSNPFLVGHGVPTGSKDLALTPVHLRF